MKNLRDNLSIKILALLMAILAWYYVMQDKNPLKTYEFAAVPVEIAGTGRLSEEKLVLVEPKNPTVNILVEAKRNELNRLSAKDLRPRIDLSEATEEGSYNLRVRVDKPSAVDIKRVDKQEITVKLESIVKKSIPITVRLAEKLPDDFILKSTTSTPKEVRIEGPSSKVALVTQVVATLDLQGETKSRTQNVAIEALDQDGKVVEGVTLSHDYVSVTAEIRHMREVPVEVVTMGSLPEGVTLIGKTVTPKTVKVMGSVDDLSKLTSLKSAPIDLSSIRDDTKVKLALVLPDGVELYGDGADVHCDFVVDKEIEKDILVPYSAIGVEGGAPPEILSTGFARVRIRGDKSLIDNWSSKNVAMKVHIAGLGKGEHHVTIEVENIPNVEILSVQPETMHIRIK